MLGVGSGAKPTGDGERSQQPAAGNNATGDNQGSPVAPLVKQPAAPSEAAVTKSQAQTEQPNPYGLRDVIAQEIMADAAVWMAVAAFLTFFVTSVGTFLIWRQVKLTRRAVDDTSTATRAMERQNEISEDTAKRQLRAYLHLKSADLTRCKEGNFPTDCDHPEQRFADVEIKNYGLTPARNTVSVCGVCVKPYPPEEPNPVGPIPEWVDRAVSELPPQRTSGLPLEVGRSGALHERLMAGDHAVYFYAEVTYEDVFGDKHRTQISLVSNGIAYQRGSFTVAKEGNHSD